MFHSLYVCWYPLVHSGLVANVTYHGVLDPRISPQSACWPRFFQRTRRRRRATRAGLESPRLLVRSATRCMMRVPQPQRHSRARTPRILRAMGGLLHKVCTLLQWNQEARGGFITLTPCVPRCAQRPCTAGLPGPTRGGHPGGAKKWGAAEIIRWLGRRSVSFCKRVNRTVNYTSESRATWIRGSAWRRGRADSSGPLNSSSMDNLNIFLYFQTTDEICVYISFLTSSRIVTWKF